MTNNTVEFQKLSPTILADILTRDRVMDIGVRALWQGMPRIAGPAYPVRCAPGDNLMLHAAIYRAPAGSIIVVESADMNYAVAGGNVCAVAQRRGIAGFVVDGALRDIAEAREIRFPVFARGVIPIPGGKNVIEAINSPVTCGGVKVSPGDMVVADEEGIIIVPVSRSSDVLKRAQERAKKVATETLDAWESAHRSKIDEILKSKGFVG